jgi:DNA-binding LytR/AlgR family response regulator
LPLTLQSAAANTAFGTVSVATCPQDRRGEEAPGEALIRTPLKELVAQLDAAQLAQVHRAVVVNLRAISHVTRGDNETANIHLKGRGEVLPVSRSYLHVFRQM